MADIQRRLPSSDKSIAEIKPEDARVGIIGTVLDKQGERVVVDDGTGKATITFNEEPQVEIGQMVRVLGRVMPVEAGFELQGEILQDMSKMDMGLFKRVKELENGK